MTIENTVETVDTFPELDGCYSVVVKTDEGMNIYKNVCEYSVLKHFLVIVQKNEGKLSCELVVKNKIISAERKCTSYLNDVYLPINLNLKKFDRKSKKTA